MAEYSKTEIAKIMGESSRKIQFWIDLGLVVPDISPPSGKGKAMIFSEKNLIEFGMIRVLQKDCKLRLATIITILRILRKGECKGQKFKDFFDNPHWGHNRDVIFIQSQPDGDARAISVKEVKRKPPLDAIEKSRRLLGISETKEDDLIMNQWIPEWEMALSSKKILSYETILLGKVKILAMKKLGISN
jgi:DNA-binding transcriptional MerR regulator